jgi:phenylacetic acid degradation operon negative regulatory protein
MARGASAQRTVAPAISLRRAAGSARALLFTVLGEFVLPSGGSAWTSSLLAALGRLGVEEKAARQALMRTSRDGWLAAERHGRRTRWHLTRDAEQLLSDGTQRIYGFAGVSDGWDGRLVLVLARVPDSDRATRHLLHTRLGWAGFGTAAPGVWISTHTERVAEVEQLLSIAKVADARIFVAEHQGGADLTGMVGQAWDLDAVEASYRAFLAEFASARTADPLGRLVMLVHRWRRFPSIDPALPRQLLPARWSGERAAGLFAERHAQWAAGATTEWNRLEQAAG